MSLLLIRGLVCYGQKYLGAEVGDTLRAGRVIDYSERPITPSQKLSGIALQQLSSQSISDALRCFSGVYIKDYGGIGGLKTVDIRSLGSQHTAIFYNGIKIYNAQNGQVDLGRYSLDNLEEISIFSANKGGSLLSASDFASASAVYLKSKKPEFDSSDRNLKATLGYGSFSTANAGLRYERKLKSMSISAEGNYLRTNGAYRYRIRNNYEDSIGRRRNGDIEAFRSELGLYSKAGGGDLQVNAYVYLSERGLPGPVIRRLSDQYSANERQADRNSFVQASWKSVGEALSLLLNSKLSSDRLEYESIPAEHSAGTHIQNEYNQNSLFLSAAGAWHPLSFLSVNLATDGNVSALNCDVKDFSPVIRLDIKTAAAISANCQGLDVQASLLHTLVKDITDNQASPLSKLSPSLVLGWSRGNYQLRAFYKSTFRPPSLNELYYTNIGNVRLRPESAKELNLGATVTFIERERFTGSISSDFHLSRIEDKIVAMPVYSQFRWSMMNFGLVKGLGAEIGLNNSFRICGIGCNTRLNYTFQKAMDCSYPGSHWYGGQIPYTPRHSASALLFVESGAWSGSISCLYTGVRYRASDNSASNRMEPWATIDLKLSRALDLSSLKMAINIEINNLLNQQYQVVNRYPMPGRNAALKLEFKL